MSTDGYSYLAMINNVLSQAIMSTYGQSIVTTNNGQWWRMMSNDGERYLMMVKFVADGK